VFFSQAEIPTRWRVGRGKITQFIEALVKPHVGDVDLDASYQELAQCEASERQASEWLQGVGSDMGEFLDEAW